MNKYDKAMKLLDDCCGNDKEVVIALGTISLSQNSSGKHRPCVRMVCAYYEDGVFYISTGASKNKMLQIDNNNEVAIAGTDWFSFNGIAENLGWVKDPKNTVIYNKFKKVFNWFDEVGDENNPDSIILKVTLTDGTIIDHAHTYGETKYDIDFINKHVG